MAYIVDKEIHNLGKIDFSTVFISDFYKLINEPHRDLQKKAEYTKLLNLAKSHNRTIGQLKRFYPYLTEKQAVRWKYYFDEHGELLSKIPLGPIKNGANLYSGKDYYITINFRSYGRELYGGKKDYMRIKYSTTQKWGENKTLKRILYNFKKNILSTADAEWDYKLGMFNKIYDYKKNEELFNQESLLRLVINDINTLEGIEWSYSVTTDTPELRITVVNYTTFKF